MDGYCSCCNVKHSVSQPFVATALLGIVGAVFGTVLAGHPLVILLVALAAAAIGQAIDRWIASRCPTCFSALVLVSELR